MNTIKTISSKVITTVFTLGLATSLQANPLDFEGLELAQNDSRWNDIQYDYKDDPEKRAAEMQALVKEYTGYLGTPEGGQVGTPQPQPNPAPGNNQHSQLIQQAAAAIQSGKDRNAVIQRLVEMGVPQDQINL